MKVMKFGGTSVGSAEQIKKVAKLINDGERNIVVLSAIPVAVSAFYLRLMAGLSRSFAKKETLKALVSADSPKTLWKVVVKATRREVK